MKQQSDGCNKNDQKYNYFSQDHFLLAKQQVDDDSYIKNTISSHTQQYYRILQYANSQDKQRQQLIKTLELYNITNCKTIFYQDLRISVLHTSLNYEMITVKVQYGQFCQIIDIINIDSSSPSSSLTLIGQGNQGQVYRYYHHHQQFIAIKSIEFNDDNFTIVLKEAINQYFILSIASALRIGPSTNNVFGFNIIIYRQSIQFAMEYCDRTQQNGLSAQDIKSIKAKLYKLHLLNIVHLDIKPNNLAFSTQQNEFVYIDFGISKIIKQSIGFKSFTEFNGTYNFCSNQMASLFIKQTQGLVDLYHNDAICLNQTISSINCQNICQMNGEDNDNQLKIDLEDMNIGNIISKVKQKLISLKFLLYNTTFQIKALSFKQLLRDYEYTIIKHSFEIKLLLMYLPLNNALLFCELMYFIESNTSIVQLLVKQKMRLKYNFQIIIINDLSAQCFNSLQRSFLFTKAPSKQLNITLDTQLQLLMNEEYINNLKTQQYHLRLINFIKLNGQSSNKQQIMKVCLKFTELNHKHQQNNQNFDQLYQYCIKAILYSCLSLPFNNIKYQILKAILSSVIILQIIQEEQLRHLYTNIFHIFCNFHKKISLIMQFFTSLQYIKEKFISKYCYSMVLNDFSNQLQQYLKNIQLIKQNQLYLLHIVNTMLAISKQQNPQIYTQFIQQQLSNMNNKGLTIQQSRIIKKQIFIYMLHVLYCSGSRNIHQQKSRLTSLLSYDSKCDNVKNNFKLSCFYQYYLSYRKSMNKQSQSIYNIFIQRLGCFQSNKYYKINIVYCLSKIHHKFRRYYFRQSLGLEIIQQIMVTQDYNYLMQTYNFIIVSNNQCLYQYISLLFDVYLLQTNKLFLKLMNQIIVKNFDIIIERFLYPNYNNIIFHSDIIKLQINTMMKILIFISQHGMYSLQSINVYFRLISQRIKLLVDQVKKVQCKALCLLQFKRCLVEYHYSQGQYYKSINLQLQLLCTVYKQASFCNCLHFQFMNLIFLNDSISKNIINLQGSTIIDLIYTQMKRTRKYQYALIKYKNFCPFLILYLHIYQEKQLDQLLQFIMEISNSIKYKFQSSQVIDNFYLSMVQIIKIQKQINSANAYNSIIPCIHQQIAQSSSNSDHLMIIIPSLLSKRLSFMLAYLALYFVGILSIKIHHKSSKRMITKIALFIDFINHHAKALVLSKYYQYYAFYFYLVPRKKVYVNKLIAKNEQQKQINLNRLKRNLKIKCKNIVQNQKYNRMIEKLQRYCKNINQN